MVVKDGPLLDQYFSKCSSSGPKGPSTGAHAFSQKDCFMMFNEMVTSCKVFLYN